jgi:hypothetical protein
MGGTPRRVDGMMSRQPLMRPATRKFLKECAAMGLKVRMKRGFPPRQEQGVYDVCWFRLRGDSADYMHGLSDKAHEAIGALLDRNAHVHAGKRLS